MNELAAAIKERLPAKVVFEAYGFTPNRAGFIQCPFHEGDRTGSLKIYDGTKGWHCFGCGAGSSVIDLAMRLFDLDFKDACAKLNSDFGLGLTDRRPSRSEMAAALRARKEAEEKKRAQEKYYLQIAELHRELYKAKMENAPKPGDLDISPVYADAVKRLPYLEWWLDENISIGR